MSTNGLDTRWAPLQPTARFGSCALDRNWDQYRDSQSAPRCHSLGSRRKDCRPAPEQGMWFGCPAIQQRPPPGRSSSHIRSLDRLLACSRREKLPKKAGPLLVIRGHTNRLVAVIGKLAQLAKRHANTSAAKRKRANTRVVHQDPAIDRVRIGWISGHQMNEALRSVGFINVAAHNHATPWRVRRDGLGRWQVKRRALGGLDLGLRRCRAEK